MARNQHSARSVFQSGSRRTTRGIAVALSVGALATFAIVFAGQHNDDARSAAASAAVVTTEVATQVGGEDEAPTEDQAIAPPAVDPQNPAPEVDPKPNPDPGVNPDPQVPVGGNGDLAPTPPPLPPTCNGACAAPVELTPLEQPQGNPAANLPIANSETAGCSIRCITRAQVFDFAEASTDLDVEVVTRTPATIEVYIDDEAPQMASPGRPYFPGVAAVARTQGDLDLYLSTTLTGLDEETKYWIIVSATDEDGRREYVTGTVATKHLDDDVEVVFAAIDVLYDGDKGANKGELFFQWSIGTDKIGSNGQYKREDGSRIDLDNQVNSYTRLNLEGALPMLTVTGLEKDPEKAGGSARDTGRCLDRPDLTAFTGAGANNDCGYAWNWTLPLEPTIADISQMASCGAFDIGEEFADYRCTRITTVQSFGGIPEFSVVVAFKVF